MQKLIPQIDLQEITEIFKKNNFHGEIKELSELKISKCEKTVRKRFFKLILSNGNVIHLTYGYDLKRTYQCTKKLSTLLPEITCKPLFLYHNDELELFGQEFFEGIPIDVSLEKNIKNEKSVNVALIKIFKSLDTLTKKSTKEAFNKELKERLNKYSSNFSKVDKILLQDVLIPAILKRVKEPSPKIRWSPGDLISKNILISKEGTFKIIDFEFANLTHFYDEDFVRLDIFSNKLIQDLPTVKNKVKNVPDYIKLYFWIRQIFLSSESNTVSEFQKISLDFTSRFQVEFIKIIKSYNLSSSFLDSSNRMLLKSIENEKSLKSSIENLNAKVSNIINLHQKEKGNLNKRINSLKKENLLSINKIDRMKSSFSWRVTSLLRLLRRISLDRIKANLIEKRKYIHHFDSPVNLKFFHNGTISFEGWAFDKNGMGPKQIFAKVGKNIINFSNNLQRNDLKEIYQELQIPCNFGFKGKVKTKNGFKKIQIIVTWFDGREEVIFNKLIYQGISLKFNLFSKFKNYLRCNSLRKEYIKNLKPLASKIKYDVNIIIPVYDDFNLTKKCLNSVLSTINKNNTVFSILIINDNSPNKNIVELINEIRIRDDVFVISNEKNIGFIDSVNKALLASSKSDVILLNSDTEVYGNWVDRIYSVYKNNEKVATVTPLSNNATICSYPNFPNGSELPYNFNAELIDSLCKKHNKGNIYEVPTGVGSCMFISRESIIKVGYLDSKLFGKGYGEENDLCLRLKAKGFRNVLLTDTYIYHFGGASFKDEKRLLCIKALEKINNLYPSYEKSVASFINNDIFSNDRFKLDTENLKSSSLPIVVCVGNNRGGGTLKFLKERAVQKQSLEIRLFLTLSLNRKHMLNLYYLPNMIEISKVFKFHEIEEFFNIINPSYIEVHQLLDYPYSFSEFILKLKIRYSVYIHDFFLKCPQVTLSNNDGIYCSEPPKEECQACISDRPVKEISNIIDWRNKNKIFLQNADKVFVPSKSTRYHMSKEFKDINFRVKPHEPNIKKKLGDIKFSDQLRIGIIGALSKEKGADFLEQTVNSVVEKHLPVKFYLIGFPSRKLLIKDDSYLTITGPYEDSNVKDFLKQYRINVIWFPTRAPETFSYTLSHALENSYPVIIPDVGSFKERVYDKDNLYKFSWKANVEDIISIIINIIEDNEKSLLSR
jgi:GT2 family glycosyltransferase